MSWDDSEVARRWMMLCPVRKKSDRSAEEPNEFELNFIRNDPILVGGGLGHCSRSDRVCQLRCANKKSLLALTASGLVVV